MAKKTTKPATNAKKQAPSKKTTKKTTKKAEPVAIELDEVEATAIELVHSSSKVCTELEKAVTAAVSDAVRKVFKQHRVSLTSEQAQKVALLLFGD